MADYKTLTPEKVDQMNAEEYTPAIVVMTLVVCFGLIGNIFAAIFYIRKTKQSVLHIFISCLSVNDAVTNIVLVQEIVQLFFYLSGKDIITCKLFLVIKHWLVGNSLLFLVAITADRYHRVVFAFSRQITYPVAKLIVFGLTSFSFLISSRNIATGDIFEFNITADSNSTITGYYCTQSKEKDYAQVKTIFHIVDICIHGIVMCSFVILNILLMRKIMQSQKKLQKHGPSVIFKINELRSETSVDRSSTDIVHIDFDSSKDNIELTAKKPKERKSDLQKKSSTLKSNQGTLRRTLSRQHSTQIEIKITIMVVVITVISALCFVPYYVAMLTVKQDFSGSTRIMSVAEILARRSYILNSAVNPFVMMIFNLPFRQFVYSIVCFKCVKGRNMCNI